MSDDDNVIDMTDMTEWLTVKPTDYSHSACKHQRIYVDQREGVQCRSCGIFLDPLGVLLMYAKLERVFQSRSADARAELAGAHKELLEVKRQIKNAKARLRRAK